jgi:hypothetical protein
MSTVTQDHLAPDLDRGPVFTPQLSERFALAPRHVLVTAVLAGLLLVFSYIPLRGTDLWCHVAWGNSMLSTRQIPTADPTMKLAEGMRVVDTAPLSQLLLAVTSRLGDAALSNLFAVLSLVTYVVLLRVYYLRTGSLAVATLGMLAALALGWSRLATIRPEMFGSLAFALLLWIASRPQSRGTLFLTALLMLVWANLHGSFAVGLILLACLTLGEFLSSVLKKKSLVAALGDEGFRGRLFALQAGALATLVNPYGIDLWLEVARFSKNPNLRDLVEWFPLAYGGIGALECGIAGLVLMIVLRWSQRTIAASEVLLLTVFGLAALSHVRMLAWFAPVFVWVVLPHLVDVLESAMIYFGKSATRVPGKGKWHYSLICLLIAWVGFAFSDLSRPLLNGKPKAISQLYGEGTPISATSYLAKHPATGLVFAPQAWADWLSTHAEVKPMVTSNVHLVPAHVWQEYLQIYRGQLGWQNVLDRYVIKTVVVDKRDQTILGTVLRRSTDWQIVQESDDSMIFVRKVAKAKS